MAIGGPRVRRGAGDSFARAFQRVGAVCKMTEMARRGLPRISRFVSKNMCTLEIDLEIAAALPDKAHKPKRVFISKSPEIFSSGGTTRLRTAPPSTYRTYADAPVGIFVGIYRSTSLRERMQPRDMNSVGDQPSPKPPSRFTRTSPLRPRLVPLYLPALPETLAIFVGISRYQQYLSRTRRYRVSSLTHQHWPPQLALSAPPPATGEARRCWTAASLLVERPGFERSHSVGILSHPYIAVILARALYRERRVR